MVEKILHRIARFLAPKYFEDFEKKVNNRVLQIVSNIDPFELVLKEFHGVFSEEYDRPEEKLDERGKSLLESLGYQLRDDQSFKFLLDWITNTQANATLKRAPVTTDRILYGRAQISGIIQIKNEIKRLASLYEERINSVREEVFDKNESVE